jgi:GT2 family glycosyltransferase
MSVTPRIVVLGMMSRIPVPGVVWQTLHYLIGFRQLGFDVYYVEDNGMTPRGFFVDDASDGWSRAADFVGGVMTEFGFADRWAVHAEHAQPGGRRHYGLSAGQLSSLYRSAALLVNLHGNARPRPEHTATNRLVLVETDPVELQVQLAAGNAEAIEYASAHSALFTFGESYGQPGCLVPTSDRYRFTPTRQPVVLDLWQDLPGRRRAVFTTVGNWHQPHRQILLDGETYHWSKDREWAAVLDLPRHSKAKFELALSSLDAESRTVLTEHGWRLREPLREPHQREEYRSYIATSTGEFTVAKDQNVRLRSGWFSDRSATYLAAGRPVVTQDTGFGEHLPTGKGLFAYTTIDEAADAVREVSANWKLHSQAATEIARTFFDATRVLGDLVEHLGVRPERRARTRPKFGLPRSLDIHTVSRWPTRIQDGTVAAARDLIARRLDEARHQPTPRPVRVPHVSIVIPVRDNVEFTAMCLESLLCERSAPSFEVVVVDNGSSDLTPRYLEAMGRLDGRVRAVRSAENLGFAKGCNLGIANGTGDVVVLLNNDTIVPPGWLARLVAHLDRDGVGLVGPVTNHTCNEAQISVGYRTYAEMVSFATERRLAFHDRVNELATLAMFCVAGTRTTFLDLGALDEGFGIGLFEDDDYSVRARQRGLRLLCADDVFVHHFGEASIGSQLDAETYRELFDTNRARFEDKWGQTWRPHARRVDPEYLAECAAVASAVDAVVPPDATVTVVAKGDDRLLVLGARTGWHFPGDAAGAFTGEYPSDSAQAIRTLETQISAGADHLVFPPSASWWLDHYGGLAAYLQAEHGPALRRDDVCTIWQLRGAARTDAARIHGLRDRVARQGDELARLREELESLRGLALEVRQASTTAAAEAPVERTITDTWQALDALMVEVGATKRTRYLLQRVRFREAVQHVTRPGAVVAVVSHGDDDLLALRERTGWHVPRLDDGQWSAGLPSDSTELIADLERLRASGAQYLALPAPYHWWLDHYNGLPPYLRRSAIAVMSDEELGWVWDLEAATELTPGTPWPLDAVIGEATTRIGGRPPTVLDWDTGLKLAEQLPELVVFSPPLRTDTLPYLDATVDVVVLRDSGDRRRREADRVAHAGIVIASDGSGLGARFAPEWKA